MKKRIFGYFISLIGLLMVSLSISAQAQKKIMKQPVKEIIPLYNGTYIGADLYGLGSNLLGGDFLSSEVSFSVNLKRRFFPVLEVGYGKTNTTNEEGLSYKSSAPYVRIGVNYNTMFKKKSDNFLYVGARYGFSSFKYDIIAPSLTDDIFSGEVPFSYLGEKSNASWLELVLGVQAQVYKSFLMGWSLRYKSSFSVKENLHTTPWYIPGFGKNKSTSYGVTYSIIYKLPF